MDCETLSYEARELPLASPFSLWLWEMKVLLMIYIFVYAFFKFTWATWQYNGHAFERGSHGLFWEVAGTAQKQTPNRMEVGRLSLRGPWR